MTAWFGYCCRSSSRSWPRDIGRVKDSADLFHRDAERVHDELADPFVSSRPRPVVRGPGISRSAVRSSRLGGLSPTEQVSTDESEEHRGYEWNNPAYGA